jgi:hypothetical protein
MFRRAWLCCLTLVLVPCCCSHGHSSWSYVSEAGRCPHQNIACGYCELFPWSLKLNTYPPSMEKIKNACCFDFIGLCAFITVFQHWWFWSLFKTTGMCWMLLCLHVEYPVSDSEEGGSQVMWNTENSFMLCFVCSQLGAGWGNTSPWLGSNVMSPWGIGYPTKVSFENTFSFRCFHIHCTCPPQESKVQVCTVLTC